MLIWYRTTAPIFSGMMPNQEQNAGLPWVDRQSKGKWYPASLWRCGPWPSPEESGMNVAGANRQAPGKSPAVSSSTRGEAKAASGFELTERLMSNWCGEALHWRLSTNGLIIELGGIQLCLKASVPGNQNGVWYRQLKCQCLSMKSQWVNEANCPKFLVFPKKIIFHFYLI